jgi:hypothetical protein
MHRWWLALTIVFMGACRSSTTSSATPLVVVAPSSSSSSPTFTPAPPAQASSPLLPAPATPSTPPNPAFQSWLAGSAKTYAGAIPRLASGSCGGPTLAGANAVSAIFAANMLLGQEREKSFSSFTTTHQIDAAEASAIFTAYYISVLSVDYGFSYAEAMFGHDWYKGDQPILRGHVLEASGAASHQVYWKDGEFQREFRSPLPPPAAADGYAAELMASRPLPKLPGLLDALLVANNGHDYALSVDGTHASAATPFDPKLGGGNGATGQRTIYVQTTKPCSFVDVNGRKLTGGARDTYKAPVISLGPDPASSLGLTRPIHVVRIEINGGRGSIGAIDWMATGVQRLDGGATYKIDASRAVDDARARFAKLATAEDANLSRKLDGLRKDREARAVAETNAHAKLGSSPETQRSPASQR